MSSFGQLLSSEQLNAFCNISSVLHVRQGKVILAALAKSIQAQ